MSSLQDGRSGAPPGLTPDQAEAVWASGNVLVMAGAGTGKTRTLVERVLFSLGRVETEGRVAGPPMAPARVTELLVVTFTEAAAAQLRERIRQRLEEIAVHDPSAHWWEQLALLDTAAIGTLHSFCYRLVTEHFADLGLDPRATVLEESEALLLQREVFDEVLEEALHEQAAGAEALQQAFLRHFRAETDRLRDLVLRVHAFSQSLTDPERWYREQLNHLEDPYPTRWKGWWGKAAEVWRQRWQHLLEREKNNGNSAAALILQEMERWQLGRPDGCHRTICPGRWSEFFSECLRQLAAARNRRIVRRKDCDAIAGCLQDLQFLERLMPGGRDASGGPARSALAEDWDRVRQPMAAVLRLAERFGTAYAEAKRQRAVMDFADLEQFALRLLWDRQAEAPTALALRLRTRFRWVFVDEYQDINPAQDLILQAVSGEDTRANRFLVGDVKQSIYQFRRANPRIFRQYAQAWANDDRGRVVTLQENFRSRPELLMFVNAVFNRLMRAEVGGVEYGPDAWLKPGPVTGANAPCASLGTPAIEIWLWANEQPAAGLPSRQDAVDGPQTDADQWTQAEREARLLAERLRQMVAQQWPVRDPDSNQIRPVRFSDIAVLLRSPGPKAEAYVRQFVDVGVPLEVPRKGFFESLPVADLLNLLRILDNPLQDLPLLAVLRSPLVGLSLDELAWICAWARHLPVWHRLHLWLRQGGVDTAVGIDESALRRVLERFLRQYARWRQTARQAPVSQCLETILRDTQYLAWVESRPEGRLHRTQVERCLDLARDHDRTHGEGLSRFLQRIQSFEETGTEPEVSPTTDVDAVRLLSIHQSKGLEFPVVAVADLGKPFNREDLQGEVLLDEEYGLASRIPSANGRHTYPTLSYWLAQRRRWQELLGEEIRLLYVAFTRARDHLILSGRVRDRAHEPAAPQWTAAEMLEARCPMDWLVPVLRKLGLESGSPSSTAPPEGTTKLFRYRWVVADDIPLASPPADDATGGPSDKQTVLNAGPEATEQAPEVLARLRDASYPYASATHEPAKTSVTTAQRRWADETPVHPLLPRPLGHKRRFPRPPLTATERGTAHHRFLRHFRLDTPPTMEAFRAETDRLQQAGYLTAQESNALDLGALVRFWSSELGKQLREHQRDVRRELTFTFALPANELRRLLGQLPDRSLENERVVLQGAADLVVIRESELWLVDFKTDHLAPNAVLERARQYFPQLRLYTRALEAIYRRPIRHAWLHFLLADQTVEVPTGDPASGLSEAVPSP